MTERCKGGDMPDSVRLKLSGTVMVAPVSASQWLVVLGLVDGPRTLPSLDLPASSAAAAPLLASSPRTARRLAHLC